jgi:hypothetical protein
MVPYPVFSLPKNIKIVLVRADLYITPAKMAMPSICRGALVVAIKTTKIE